MRMRREASTGEQEYTRCFLGSHMNTITRGTDRNVDNMQWVNHTRGQTEKRHHVISTRRPSLYYVVAPWWRCSALVAGRQSLKEKCDYTRDPSRKTIRRAKN
jgi:hypothetical protein